MLIAKSFIISILVFTTLIGINIPIMIFDLILKTISFVSGSAFFNSIFSEGVEWWTSPIFITYTTIFVLTLIMSISYTITYSVKRVYNKIDLDSNKGFTTSDFFKRYKFLVYWLVGFFLVPFLVNLLLVGVSALSSLFGLEILSNGIYDKFTIQETTIYFHNISLKSKSYLEVLNQLLGKLNEIKSDPNLNIDNNDLEQLNNQIKNIQGSINGLEGFIFELGKFNTIIQGSEWNKNNLDEFNFFLTKIIEIKNNILGYSNNIDVGLLKSLFEIYTPPVNGELIPNIDTYFDEFLKIKSSFGEIVNTGEEIDGHYLDISLNNLATLNSNKKVYISEKTTMILSEILYGKPIIDPFQNLHDNGWIGGTLDIIWKILSNIVSLITNWKDSLILITKTIALVFVLSSFMNIAINFGKRTFQLLGLVIVSPYFFVSGIKDEGKKLTIWFETVIGKILLIVFVSLAIEIWSILLLSLNQIPLTFKGIYGEVDGVWGYTFLLVFIQAIILVSSTYALLEFINYLSEIFKAQDMFQSKNRLYGREFNKGLTSTTDTGNKVFNKTKAGINYTRQRFDVNSDLFKAKEKSTFGKYVNAPIKKFKSKKVGSK